MNMLNPSRKSTGLRLAGFTAVLSLLGGWLATSAHAGVVFTSLYSFTNINDGSKPFAGLVQGSDVSLYGTTEFGGTNDSGTVFKVNPDGTAFTTLYRFSAGTQISEESEAVTNSDGAYPKARLILVGNTLYGTTSGGGASRMPPPRPEIAAA